MLSSTLSSLDVNSALRTNNEDQFNSPVSRTNYFWQEDEKEHSYDWEQWLQLFEVAVLARHSISVFKLTRYADEQNPRVAALMVNIKTVPAAKKSDESVVYFDSNNWQRND